MRLGAFELNEPLPEIKEPIALAMLSPWIDVGRVGSMALSRLETRFNARELGQLKRPGHFYDFTRYRPILYRTGNQREIRLPNTFVNYARGDKGNDFLFLHCLEPHMLGETYAESVVRVLKEFKAKSYVFMGAMYDSVPHTRPLLITGSASDTATQAKLKQLNANPSTYQGPTTIATLTSDQASRLGIETLTLIVHLPHYAQLEEDYNGLYALLSVLCAVYDLPVNLHEVKRKGEEQYLGVGMAASASSQVGKMIEEMEKDYDTRVSEQRSSSVPPLSSEMEKFLKDIGKGLDPEP